MADYIRWAKGVVENALKVRRIVFISGERQCGKTTLTKQVRPSGAIWRTLDDSKLLKLALQDPAFFVQHDRGTMVIDEIQKAPLLIGEMKQVVDQHNRKGQFLITGSAGVYDSPLVKESLAGRVKNVRLHTLTEGEIQGIKPHFLAKAFAREFPGQITGYDKQSILELALRGGFPEVIKLNHTARREWHQEYVQTILDHDLRSLPDVHIRRASALKALLEVLAAWSSKYMSLSGICTSLEISKPTVLDYISLLERLYLIERIPSWIKDDYERVKKTDKVYMADPGLMASILRWHFDDIALDADRYGKLIETMVAKELAVLVGLDAQYSLYQYRDRQDHEIDFLVENEKQEILGIEVKGGSHVSRDDCKHMRWFKDKLPAAKKFTGIILYTGENTLSFGDGMFALPMAALWTNF